MKKKLKIKPKRMSQGGGVSKKIPTYNEAGYEGRSEYNPVWNEIYLAPKDRNSKVTRRHELWHANQRNTGNLRVGDSVPTIPPSILNPDAYDYYNRNAMDADTIKSHQAEIHQNLTGNIWTPDMNLMSNDFKDLLAHEASYHLPWTAEGEAEQAAQQKWKNPYKMQFKKNGGKINKGEWELMEDGGYTVQNDNTRVNRFQEIPQNQQSLSLKTNQIAPSVAIGRIDYSPVNVEDFLMLPKIGRSAVNALSEQSYSPYKSFIKDINGNSKYVDNVYHNLEQVDNSLVRNFTPYKYTNKNWYKKNGGKIQSEWEIV